MVNYGGRVQAKFRGKVVLVTGGTSGIGAALADAFLSAGARVAICARNDAALRAHAVTRPGLLALTGDVTDERDQANVLAGVEDRFGRLDILVNNAGRLVERDFAHAPPSPRELNDEFALNLIAPVQLTASALARWPDLAAVVLVESGYALVAPRRAPTYGAAKAGLHAFAEGLRRQLSGGRTHVLEVLPPAVDTSATRHRPGRKVTPDAVAAATLAALAARRNTALIGVTRILPWLLRLAPRVVAAAVART